MNDLLSSIPAIDHFAKKDSTFKTFIQKLPAFKEAVKLLQIPYDITMALQQVDYTLGDFYADCISMREKLKIFCNKSNKKTNLAKHLMDEFEHRKKDMLCTQAMLATVYLDRRISVELKEREKELAKLSLCDIWERIRKDHSEKQNNITEISNRSHSDNEDSFDLQQYLRSKGDSAESQSNTLSNEILPSTSNNQSAINEPNYDTNKHDFLILLDEFEKKFPIIQYKTNIKVFFEEQKQNFPEIYILANILFAIPPSQATVERAFSQLSFVYSSRRCLLANDLLEKILLIKLNKDLVYKIFEEDLENLKTSFTSINEDEQEQEQEQEL